MFNKYAELRKIALLYTACRGLLRIKLAADTYNQWDQQDMNVNDLKNMSQEQLEDLYTQDTSHLGARAQNWLNNWAQQQQGGTANPAPAKPNPAPTNPNPAPTNPNPANPNPAPANPNPAPANPNPANPNPANPNPAPANPANPNPAQQQQPGVRHVNRQQWMQMNQRNINRAGQQAQQNATKGWFGRAMNWMTGGGWGGWANARAQNQAQQRYNNQFDTLKNDPRKLQQYNQQRRTGAQLQQFLMQRANANPTAQTAPAATATATKTGGYSLLSLFPGYRQLFNYV